MLMMGNIEPRSPLRFADLLLFVSTTLTPSLSGDRRDPRLWGWLPLNPRQVALFPIIPRFADGDCGLEDSGRGLPDRYPAHASVWLATHKIDTEKTVAQIGRSHFDAVGQHEGATKLPCGDAAMDKFARLVVLLAAADHQLIVFKHDLKLLALEAREREGDAQRFSCAAAVCRRGDAFDVVSGIAVAALANPIDQPFHLLKTQQEWAR